MPDVPCAVGGDQQDKQQADSRQQVEHAVGAAAFDRSVCARVHGRQSAVRVVSSASRRGARRARLCFSAVKQRSGESCEGFGTCLLQPRCPPCKSCEPVAKPRRQACFAESAELTCGGLMLETATCRSSCGGGELPVLAKRSVLTPLID